MERFIYIKSYAVKKTRGELILQINILDAVMGGGKTSAIINYINESNDDVRFLYITPYLTEVERVIEKCPSKNFKQPESYGTKINGIKYLFEKGENVVSTHALFKLFDSDITDLIFNNNYVLVMDEVADVIQPIDISSDDLTILLNTYTEVKSNGMLIWTAKNYKGMFKKYKNLCDLESIYVYANTAALWLFPVSVFRAFKEVYILTYLFEAQFQKCYFDFYNINYKYLYVAGDNVDNYRITEEQSDYIFPDYKSLIRICASEKLNYIGEKKSSLSKLWYYKYKDESLIKTLKNNTRNFFKNYTKTQTQYNLWTTFKKYRPDIKGKGYSKGFLSSNARATNEYKDRVAVAYLVNKFVNPCVKNFFLANKIKVDEDAYALSELLQFLFRSGIRDGKAIDLYIPSRRMRELLVDWIDEVITERGCAY